MPSDRLFESGSRFVARWTVQGSLTTSGPLVIGSGDPPVHHPRVRDESTGREVDIGPVATDSRKRAYIPGTTLKGCLRSWLASRRAPADVIVEVFGSDPPSTPGPASGGDAGGTRGGSAEFWDALAENPAPKLAAPDWNEERRTRIATGVSIDRVTRTAAPDPLFHFEYVPPEVTFDVTVSGQTLAGDGDDESRLARQIALVLVALEAFREDADPPATIGAESGNGYGRLTWRPASRPDGGGAATGVAVLRADVVASWLRDAGNAGYRQLPALTETEALWARISEAKRVFAGGGRNHLTLGLSLDFDGPFLVNDPLRAKPRSKNAAPPTADAAAVTGPADHVPLLDGRGRAYLPARSIRGSLRSQAERILRTLGAEQVGAGADPIRMMRRIACWPTTRDRACRPIGTRAQVETDLCLACRLFGAGGWRGAIQLSRFSDESDRDLPVEEFVAIDRFTGGGAEHLKFNAQFAYRPVLSGHLTIAIDRGVEPWGLGLLLLTLRDLVDGDVPMGFGRAKGYGSLTARVTSVEGHGLDRIRGLAELLPSGTLARMDEPLTRLRQHPRGDVDQLLADMVKALHVEIARVCQAGQRAPAGEAS